MVEKTFKPEMIPVRIRVCIAEKLNEIDLKYNMPLSPEYANAYTNSENGDILIAFDSSAIDDLPVIAHEAIHAKNAIFKYLRQKVTTKNDEFEAYLVTYLVRCVLKTKEKLYAN